MNKDFWVGKRVLVTGGSGFIGRWLVSELASAKARVIVLDIVPDTQGSETERIVNQIDLGDLSNTSHMIEEYGPQVVIHLAGQSSVPACHDDPIEAFKKNVDSTYNLLEACRLYGKLESAVVVSSNHVYGEQSDMPTPEAAMLNGIGIYATSKLCGDLVARAYGKTYA